MTHEEEIQHLRRLVELYVEAQKAVFTGDMPKWSLINQKIAMAYDIETAPQASQMEELLVEWRNFKDSVEGLDKQMESILGKK